MIFQKRWICLLLLFLFCRAESRTTKDRAVLPGENKKKVVVPIKEVAKVHTTRWPDFCTKHLLQDSKGCASWGENKRSNPQLEFTLYQPVADCYIDPGLLQLVGKKIELIPHSSAPCNYVYCPKCKTRVVQGYDDYEEDTLLYKCRCTGRYWIGIDELLIEDLEDIVMQWQFCKRPSIHYGYFDWFHQTYFSFFMALLNFKEEQPLCDCYWKERSAKTVLISDQVYEALEEFLLVSNKIATPFINHFSPYLAERLPQDFLSGLLLHASFFSHYQQIFHDLSLFALETLPQEAPWIESRLQEIEQEIATPFLEHYSACINCHPHPKIYRERGKLLAELFYTIEALNDYKKSAMSSSETWVELGKIYAENFFFDNAIDSFTRAIEKNPLDKEAYLARAFAHFERGNYASSFCDFAHSTFKSTPVSEENRVFSNALMEGIKEGRRTEKNVSLLASVSGFTKPLWEEGPPSEEIVVAIKNLGDFFSEKIPPFRKAFHTLPPELQEYITLKHRVDVKKKGFLLGKILGSYGVEVFIHAGDVQLSHLCHKLQRANKIFVLENALASEEAAEAIVEASESHRSQKMLFLAEQRVYWPKQSAAIPPLSNNQSYLTLSKESLEKLLKTKSGTGQPVRKKLGEGGYAERVDFGCAIGVWVEKGQKIERKRTNFGIIHYDMPGFYYLLPASPE